MEVTDHDNSTVNDTSCGQAERAELRDLERHLWIYSAPVILLFSVVGNVMTILIMTQKSMRGTSTCVYLSAMAAADMAVVVVGIIPEWLYQMDIVTVWELHPVVCQLEMYSYYTALDFAIWALVAFTSDRLIAVCFPFHKKQVCTQKRALCACVFVYLLANLNLHVFWTRGRVVTPTWTTNCGDLVEFEYFEKVVRPWLVMALASIGPFVIILSSNITIVCEILRSNSLRETKGFRQTTIMCMSISFAFLILVAPNIVLLIGKKQAAWNSPCNKAYVVARAVAGQCVYINHSVNFMLYALTGSRFREELLIRCNSLKRPHRQEPLTSRMLSMTPSELRTSAPPTPLTPVMTNPFSAKHLEATNGKLLAVADVKL